MTSINLGNSETGAVKALLLVDAYARRRELRFDLYPQDGSAFISNITLEQAKKLRDALSEGIDIVESTPSVDELLVRLEVRNPKTVAQLRDALKREGF